MRLWEGEWSSTQEMDKPKAGGFSPVPLDQSLYKPSAVELEFLRTFICGDEDEIKKRVYDAQEE